MKWYQAHLRVMSRLFELGFFDEVNSCYRKFCIEGTPSDRELFMRLVLNDNDIKLYCEVLSEKNVVNNKLDSSDVVVYYYQAIACFTMVKALPKLSSSKLDEVKVDKDMPFRPYNVLFEKNGDIKDDVLIKAFKEHKFTSSPKGFVSAFLRLRYGRHLGLKNLSLIRFSDYCYSYKDIRLTSKAANEAILRRNSYLFWSLDDSKNLQEEADKKASTVKEGNYFYIDNELDSGCKLLKVIDLLGMHLLLVAQRRQYMFERFICDDLRSNYKALAKVKSDDIVRLHNKALAACLAFEETLKGLISNASYFNDCNTLVKDYVGRNDALYQYICYFVQLFEDLEASNYSTNLANSWKIEYYYFNLYEQFKQFSSLQSKLLIVVNDLLSADGALAKCLDNHLSYEREIVNGLLDSIPPSVFDICAHFAPSFDNVNLTHPSVVDFKAIVNSVIAYSQSLNHAFPTLPYPIKKGSNYDVEDCGDLVWLKRSKKLIEVHIESINEKLAYEVISEPKPIVFSRKLNIYFEMFCIISDLVEIYNNYYLRTIYNANDEFNPGSKLSFAFDLSYCGEDLVNTIYPTYELLLKDETFIKLIECHQACFEHLVLIMDLQGDINLLYEDNYMSDLLRKTNNYDQELADSLALNKTASESSDTPNLSKAEQLLLNKTCISYLQDCQKFGQLSKEFVENTSELDKFLEEKLENFIFAKNQAFGLIQNICLYPIIAFSQYIIANMDNVPDDLKLNLSGISNNVQLNNEGSIELNQNFYKCVYETFLVFLAKNMNLFINEIIPYNKLATKEDFAKSLNSVCFIESKHSWFRNSHYLVLVAYKRLMQSCNYDTFISKHIRYNPLLINSALMWIIREYSYSLNLTILPIVKYFVRIVLSLTRMQQVEEYQPYLNMLYNLVQKLTKLFSTNAAKIGNLNTLVEQGNVVLYERFEYKSYLSEVVDVLSLYEGLWRKYNSTYSDLNHIYDACQVSGFRSLYKDLLEDAPRVLKCIDVNYYKNLGTQLHNATPYFNAQDYVSLSRDYIGQAMNAGGEGLSRIILSVVKEFFGKEIASMIQAEDKKHRAPLYYFYSLLWSRNRPADKDLTKPEIRIIRLVMDKMRILDDEELHQVLNLDSQKISAQIVDSSVAVASSKPKAKATTKSMAATTKVTTQKVASTTAPKVNADKATNDTKADDTAKETKAEPQKKAIRAKNASTATAKATAGKDASAQAIAEVELEADAKPKATAKSTRSKAKKAEEASEEKTKAKSTTKAIATKSRAKKVATVDSTEAKAEDAAEVTDAAKVAEAAPKKKASTARTTSKASASTRAKKSAAKS